MSSNPHDAQTEIHPPFFRGPTPPTSGSLGYPLQVGHEWMDTSGGIGVLRRCAAVDGGGVGTWVLDGPAVVKLPLSDADTPGGVLAWQNPEGAGIVVTALAVNVTTPASDPTALAAQAGIAADGTTLDDTLADIGLNPGTPFFKMAASGNRAALMAAGQWATISVTAGAAAGLAGFAYIYYHLA